MYVVMSSGPYINPINQAPWVKTGPHPMDQ